MPNIIRIKRRVSGGVGAPSALKSGELAHNEVDNILYVGKGDDGSGNATSIVALAGSGQYVDLINAQTIGGQKTFTLAPRSSADAVGATDLVRKSQHDLKADINAPTFTGIPAAPTPAADTNTTQLATTAFVIGQAGSASPLMNGTAAVGTSLRFARQDHVHPTDTSRAPLASPAFSGTPTAPTPANGTNTTQLATTAFVMAQRLDQHAAPTAPVAMNNQRITGLAEPTSAQDAATKNYVDNMAAGLDPKGSVRAASTGNLTLSAAQTVDGVALVAGDRVLVKDQSTPAQNGIYVVAAGSWTRATDADSWTELVNAFVFVEQGTVNGDNGFVCTVDPGGTLGTTALTWVNFAGANNIVAGNGLQKSGNVLTVGAINGIRADAAGYIELTGQAAALHNFSSNGFLVRTGADTFVKRDITVSGNGISISNGTGVSGDPQISLNAALQSLGGIIGGADQLPYMTAGSTYGTTSLTTFGRSLIDDADAAAGRTTLGLGTMATQNAASVNITGGTIDNITLDGGTF